MGFDRRRIVRTLGDDATSFAQQGLAQVQTDVNAGFTFERAQGDVTWTQNNIAGVADPIVRQQLQAQLDSLKATLFSMSSSQQQAGQQSFGQTDAQLTANATALDNDAGYTASQGNFASTEAGAAADAAEGGDANSGAGAMNVLAGGPGGSSVLDMKKLPKALLQAFGPGGVISAWWRELPPAARWGIVGAGALGGIWFANKIRKFFS